MTSDPSDLYTACEDFDTNNETEDYDSQSRLTEVNPKFDQAMFLLRSAHTLSLNYSSIEELCELTQTLVDQTVGQMQHKILCNLQDKGITVDDSVKKLIAESCSVDEMFNGLSSRTSRERYYQQYLNYVVS